MEELELIDNCYTVEITEEFEAVSIPGSGLQVTKVSIRSFVPIYYCYIVRYQRKTVGYIRSVAVMIRFIRKCRFRIVEKEW